jgi:hypothetical protein
MTRIPLLSLRVKSRNLSLFLLAFLVAGCTPTTTTLRFTGNREAVAVTNPEKPRPGDKLEALIGTRKKIFFYLPRNASITVFHQSTDPEAERKKLIASLSIGQEAFNSSCSNSATLCRSSDHQLPRAKTSFAANQRLQIWWREIQPKSLVSVEVPGSGPRSLPQNDCSCGQLIRI